MFTVRALAAGLAGTAALTALTLGAAYAVTGQPATAERLSAAVAHVGQAPARVECRPRWMDLLAPMPGPARTNMGSDPAIVEVSAAMCSQAASWPTHSPDSWPLDAVIAAGVLAHEAAHVAGIRTESLAECRALTTIADLLGVDGVPASTAVDIQQRYISEIYPNQTGDYAGSCPSIEVGNGNPR